MNADGHYRAPLETMSDNWQLLGQAAAQALGARRFRDAAMLFRQVVELVPDHADSWFNLAYSLRHARQYEAAAEAYGKAISAGMVAAEEALINRALLYSDHLGRSDLAEADLREALRLRPGLAPALQNLGMLHEDLGNRHEALEAYRELAVRAPANGRAHARLAALADDPETAIAGLRALEKHGLRGEDAAEIAFALANLLDGVGLYDEAFDSVRRANELMASLRPAHLRYDPAAQERLVDSLVEFVPADVRPEERACGERSVFVCGMFRSGSTVAEQLLGRHPAVHAAGELELVPAFVGEHLQPYPAALGHVAPEQIAQMRREYTAAINRIDSKARYITDKRPDNFLHLGLVRSLFPAARVVHTTRNPLDILLSTYFLNFAESVSYSERLGDIAHYLGQYRRLMRHWQEVFGDDMIELDYDRMVREPDSELGNAFAALGLEAPKSSHDESAADSAPIRTPSAWQARAPLHPRSSGRWKNYEKYLEPYRYLLED